MNVTPATIRRPEVEGGAEPFVPRGEYHTRPGGVDYVEGEWFASGEDDKGRPYFTQAYARVPRDAARFSGVVIVEPFHASGIAPVFMYSSPYILRSGHAWICVTSQKSALDAHVKSADPDRYAPLHIESDAPAPTAPMPGEQPRERRGSVGELLGQLLRYNEASDAILAQVGAAAARSAGPLEHVDVRHLVLVGHSQTGSVVTNYIVNSHESRRRADSSPMFDGYFPSGCPTERFGPRDVPIVQVLSDGDVASPTVRFVEGGELRHYRRPDSDDPGDRCRLYELAGVPHMGTRYPPHDNTKFWIEYGDARGFTPDDVMNSLPHNELFNMSLDHLVQWVTSGVTPPRADRIEVASDGTFAKDEFANSVGGVRCAQLDVPRATYHSSPEDADGTPTFGTVGFEVPLDADVLQKLYKDHDDYVERFDDRLDELIGQGWLLAEDADDLRREAREADVPPAS